MNENKSMKLGSDLIKIIVIIMLGGIAPLINTTIVNIAIGTLVKKLNSNILVIQWVNTGYLLSAVMAMPITGWSVKRFGGKQMWVFALLIFIMGSALSGFAWDTASLIIFRIIQGIGAGLMQPIMLMILVQAAGKERLGRVITIITLFAVIAPIFGPAIGGIIINNLNWRWIFFINIPLCLAALFLAMSGLTSVQKREKTRFDFLGLILLSPSLAFIIYGLSQAGAYKTFNELHVIISLAIGIILLAGFIINSLEIKFGPIAYFGEICHPFRVKLYHFPKQKKFLNHFKGGGMFHPESLS